jgi:hypothetical protein
MDAQALRAKMAQQREEIAALQEYFADLFPAEFMPEEGQFGVWIRQYGFDYAVIAFEESAKKMNKTQQDIEERKIKKIVDKKHGVTVAPEAFTKIGIVKFLSWIMIDEMRKAAKKA